MQNEVIEQKAYLVYRGDNVSVFKSDTLEVIVHGSGADWLVRSSYSTNHKWAEWFASRDKAESFAQEMCLNSINVS